MKKGGGEKKGRKKVRLEKKVGSARDRTHARTG